MLTAGIDIGSVSTEIVILKDGRQVNSFMINTGSSSADAAERVISIAREKTGLSAEDFEFIVTTGYGRKASDIGDKNITELSCHARGAWHKNPDTRTVIDIGGQDSKVIKISNNGKSLDFLMNDKCAAGTGRFLEVMARALEVKVDELGSLALAAAESVQISSMCTVFAESEVVSLIAEGHPKELIIRGLMDSIASRIAGMAHRVGLVSPVMLTGGVAKNAGVQQALKQKLNMDIEVPDEPQMIGALGAALIANDEAQNSKTG
jgi:predicted CoA-substrate-specific enzyme activase